MLLFAIAATAAVSEQTRSAIDQAMGRKGTYIAEEGVYKIIIAREDATIVQDYQTLSPNLGLNSWVAFTSGIHHEAVLTGQFLLLDDEVNPVLDVILAAGLNVSGLAESCHFGGKQLYTLDFTGCVRIARGGVPQRLQRNPACPEKGGHFLKTTCVTLNSN